MTNSTILTPDLQQAEQFLRALDPKAEQFQFQHINDKVKDDAKASKHLPLDKLRTLTRKQRQGYGVFYTVNHIPVGERRTIPNVDVIRAVFADDDVVRDEPRTDWPLQPSIITESSKGKYHYLWSVVNNGEVMEPYQAEGIKRAIADTYGTDFAGASGPNRVLRVPGFWHQKKEPFMSRLIAVNDVKYSPKQLTEAFGVVEEQAPTRGSFVGEDAAGIALLNELTVIKEKSEGYYHVVCPWHDEHSDKTDTRADFMLAGTGGFSHCTFNCHHDHKEKGQRTAKDVAALFDIDVEAIEFDAATATFDDPVIKLLTRGISSIFKETETKKKYENNVISAASRFRIVPDKWEPDQYRETEWLVDTIVEKHTVGIVYGATGTHKSFQVIDMGMHIASGKPYCGNYVEQGHVFYLASEGEGGINRRTQAWNKHFGHKNGGRMVLSNVPAKLGDEKYMQSLSDEIDFLSGKAAPALIIIDTLSASSGGDLSTNDNDDVAKMIQMCKEIRQKLGCTIIIVHHTGHTNTDRMRGASALLADVDAAWLMKVDGVYTTFEGKKMKDGELTPLMTFEPKFIELGKNSRTGKFEGSLVLVHEADDISPADRYISGVGVEANSHAAIAIMVLFDAGGEMKLTEWGASVKGRLDVKQPRSELSRAKKWLLEKEIIVVLNDEIVRLGAKLPK